MEVIISEPPQRREERVQLALRDRSLKVVLLAGYFYPDSRGGTEAHVHWLARDLASMGHRVTIAAPSREESMVHYRYDDIFVFRYPVAQNPTGQELQGEVPDRHFEEFARWLATERPDVVHIHSLTRGCGLSHARCAKSLGIPVAITVHVADLTCARGTMMRWGSGECDGVMKTTRCAACCLQKRGLRRALAWCLASIPGWVSGWLPAESYRAVRALRFAGWIEKRSRQVRELLEISDRIIVVSDWLEKVLLRNGVEGRKLLVCRNGLPGRFLHEASTVRERSGRLRVGYLGRFHPVKGIETLIAAVRSLPNDVLLRLILYGVARGEEEREYLRGLRKLAGNDPRIRFGGELSDEDRLTVFQSFDIVAIPSICLEAGPLVALEAFASGVPVIGSRSGGLREVICDGVNGVLVQPGDVDAWRRALEALLAKWRSGAWHWRIPPVRASQDVALEMATLYRELTASGSARALP